MKLLSISATAVACFGIFTWTSPARAGEEAAAEALFEQGVTLFDEGKLAEACPKLAESYRLDPATGTLLALALCHEREGKLASAWAELTEVEGRAQREGQADRRQLAHQKAEALRPRLSTLSVEVSEALAQRTDLEIRRDGTVLGRGAWNVPVPIDGGDHEVVVSAPGKKPWRRAVTIAAESAHVGISVTALDDAPPEAVTPSVVSSALRARRRAHGTQPWRALEWAGVGSAGAGVVALGVGGIFLANALQSKTDASPDCSGEFCSPAGLAARADAVREGNWATAFMLTGGLLVATGASLFAVGRVRAAAHEEATLVVSAVPTASGLRAALVGRF